MQTFIPQNPDYQAVVAEKMLGNHFMNHLGFQSTVVKPGYIEGFLNIEEHHRQQIGFIHGGVIATLADLAAGFASFTLVKAGEAVVTAEMKISYLNPGIGNKAFCKGYVIKAGRMLHFAEAEIYAENKGEMVLIAKGSATYAVIVPQI